MKLLTCYKVINIIGLVLILIGTGILGFTIPKKGDLIKAPKLGRARLGIVLIVIGTFLQIIATSIS